MPTDAHDGLAVLARTDGGVTEIARRSVGGTLRGNLATATVAGKTSLGVTTRDGTFRVWPGG